MLAVISSDDGGLTWSPPVDIGARAGGRRLPGDPARTVSSCVVYLWQTRPFAISSSRSTDGGATFDAPVRIADADDELRAARLPRVSAPVCRRRRLRVASGRRGTTAHSRARRATSSSSPRSAERRWSAPTAVTRGRDAVLPAIGIDPANGPRRDRLHAGPCRRDRRRARSSRRRMRAGSALRVDSRRRRCRSVDARHDLRPDARRLHLGALRGRATARRLGARLGAGRRRASARPCTRRAADARRSDASKRRLQADRVPDGLQLEERRDLPRALGVAASSGRRA